MLKRLNLFIYCFCYLINNVLAYDGVFAKGEITYKIDKPKSFCRPARRLENSGRYQEEMLQLIFPQMPLQTSLVHSEAFTVNRLTYLLDNMEITTDVSGDNCKNSATDSVGSDLQNIFENTKQYKLTEHVFALYTQVQTNCVLSYRTYRTVDATFWNLPIKLKTKKDMGPIIDLGEIQDTDCRNVTIDDVSVQDILQKELKKDFIQHKMQPETQEWF